MIARNAVAAVLLCLVAGLAGPARAGSAYDFELVALEGGALPLARFEGQPILLVNTASFCGFTYQYEALQALWDAKRAEGLVVLGVPSDDFGQEHAENSAVKQFCEVNFGIDFPMAAMTEVRGPQAAPLYRWLAESLGPAGVPGWNFHKVLIDRSGKPVGGWPSRVEPDDPALLAAIEKALAQ
jgi:glutathione peroxidase